MKKIYLLLICQLAFHIVFAQVNYTMSAVQNYNDQDGGLNGQPNTGRTTDGDNSQTAWSINDSMYVTNNDGYGPNNALYGSGGRNLFLQTISDNYLIATLINSMDDFGTQTQLNTNGWTDGCSWKSHGIDCYNGAMYWCVARQNPTNFYSYNVSIIKSLDNGATWYSPQHTDHTTGACTGTPQATGDAPTSGQAMFASSTGIGGLLPIQYCQDGTVNCPVVDSNDIYKYFIARDTGFSYLYCLRVHLTDYPLLDGTLYQYYTGGTFSDPDSWSYSDTGKKDISVPGYAALPGTVLYLSRLAQYALVTGYNDSVKISFSPTPGGPWTAGTTLHYDGFLQHWYSPVLKSLADSSDQTTIEYVSTGDYTQRASGAANRYSLHFHKFIFGSLTTSVQEINQPEAVETVYPNPVSKMFTVYGLPFTVGRIEIYNVLGQVCLLRSDDGVRPNGGQSEITNQQSKISTDVSSLPGGVYFIQIVGEEGKWEGRFVKE